MFDRYRHLMSLLAVIAAAPLAPAAVAQEFPESDTREITSYLLTDAGLAKFTPATHNLAAIANPPWKNCDEEDARSLDDAVAKVDAVPGARAAIKSAGMTTREYLLFSWSLAQTGVAAWALAQPGAKPTAGISMANVNFYRKHEAALKKLSEETKAADCDGNDEADDTSQY